MLRRWQRRLRYWLQSGERARLLREEMKIHLGMKTQELMEDGMTESDARGAARRQFGNPTLKQEKSRSTWIARWLSDLVQDSGFAVRTIRKQPGFAALAVISAALGIGACSMIFGIANAALFRPLPVDDPTHLTSISGKNLRRGGTGGSLAYPDFEDLRQARSFQGMTAWDARRHCNHGIHHRALGWQIRAGGGAGAWRHDFESSPPTHGAEGGAIRLG